MIATVGLCRDMVEVLAQNDGEVKKLPLGMQSDGRSPEIHR